MTIFQNLNAKDWIQCIFTVILLISMVLLVPMQSLIQTNRSDIYRIDRVQIPRLQNQIFNNSLEIRQMRVLHDQTMKKLDKIDENIQYIRRNIIGK